LSGAIGQEIDISTQINFFNPFNRMRYFLPTPSGFAYLKSLSEDRHAEAFREI
jgi:hypothetical protein